MTDYSKMSGFEINKAVGLATGEATASEPVFNQVIRNSTGREFNPCNSWADAGPIMEANRISLDFDGEYFGGKPSGMVGAYIYNYSNNRMIRGPRLQSPCRAICITFLMMKDTENANPS